MTFRLLEGDISAWSPSGVSNILSHFGGTKTVLMFEME